MVTELQFVAVAVFLIWASWHRSAGVLTADPDAALVGRTGTAKARSPDVGARSTTTVAFGVRPHRRRLGRPPIDPAPEAHAT